jgi:hypothetical protein
MDGKIGGYTDRTFFVRIDSDVIEPLNGGYATRITLMGDFVCEKLFIGPVSTKGPFIAATLYPLTFNGGDRTAHVAIGDDGEMVPMITDPMPIGIDGSRGLIVTGYISSAGNGVVGTKRDQLGWQAGYTAGDDAANVDKSKSDIDSKPYAIESDVASVAVEAVEGYYTPPQEATGFYTPPPRPPQ